MTKIVCLGDSITEGIGDSKFIGWPGRVALSLHEKKFENLTINNLGIAGNTLSDLLIRLQTEVSMRNPDILIISAGVNDLVYRLWPETTHPKTSFTYRKEIWEAIIDKASKICNHVIVLNLLPVNEDLFPLIYMPFDSNDNGITVKNTDIEDWNTYLKIHNEMNSAKYTLMDTHENCPEILKHLNDGLHPNSKGYDIISHFLTNTLLPFVD